MSGLNTPGVAVVALENSIMQKGKPATAGAKILENFISPYDATVVERLNNVKDMPMDEFGIPSFFPHISIPYKENFEVPDSSVTMSTINAVADNVISYFLCNDVFGSYRRQVVERNCCYIRPTYGTVSRYGLIPLASSMDQIGIVCQNLNDGFTLLSTIAGKDERDAAMFPERTYDYGEIHKNIEDITIAIPESIIPMADQKAQESIRDFAGNFPSLPFELKFFNVYKQVMYILSCAEISHNINRYDGIKFGRRASNYNSIDELYTQTRTEGFNHETHLTAIMGSLVLSSGHYNEYYEKAMRIRRLIKESILFDEYDILLLPCKISEDPYENLSLYALAPLAGLPSVSFSYKGQGIQLIANSKCENLLLAAWEKFQT